jgi:hypothetical protein
MPSRFATPQKILEDSGFAEYLVHYIRGPQAVAAHGMRITTVRSVVVMVLSRAGIDGPESIK